MSSAPGSWISVLAPLGAVVVLELSLAVRDQVIQDRAPPPWPVQVMPLAAALGQTGPVRSAAMAVRPPAVVDAPFLDEPRDLRRTRLPVLIGATLIALAIAVFLALIGPGTSAVG